MKISVQVKPGSRKEEVTRRDDGVYVVKVNAPPIEGKANERLVEVLAEHFHRPRRAISILSGHRGKHKIVDVQ